MAIPRQLPNAITIARIPLAVIFFILLLMGGTYGLDDIVIRWVAVSYTHLTLPTKRIV